MDFIPYGHQWIDGEDIKAVMEVLKADRITQGPRVDEFEKKVSDYCGARYAVAMSSGTAALHAACAVAGISEGDEAITTPITFAATANAIIYCQGKPVFADIRDDSLNISPDEIKKRLTRRTKAILPVDFAGLPADLDEINAMAKEKGIIVIEDACHALGAEYKGRRVGSLSDMTIFSFHPVKHITTGEGGMVLTDNEQYYLKLKAFRHHGIVNPENSGEGTWYYEIHQPGHNFRITDIQCALGSSQMNRLDYFIKRRRDIASRYNEAFYPMEDIRIPPQEKDRKAVYHIYVIQLKTSNQKKRRKEIFEALTAENIGVGVHYLPVHLHPYYKKTYGFKNGDFPKAENYYDGALTLPLFPRMTDYEVEFVIRSVRKVIASIK